MVLFASYNIFVANYYAQFSCYLDVLTESRAPHNFNLGLGQDSILIKILLDVL